MSNFELVGSSPKFRALLDEVNLVAKVDSTVLIQGETGTGKELIARAIHDAGHRRANRFVALNCAAIPDLNLVAKVDSTVLIQGETGTGKELIARAIHDAGHRRANRFVALNCAAI